MVGKSTGELGYSRHGGTGRANGLGLFVGNYGTMDEHIAALRDVENRYREYDRMRTDSRVSSTLRALFQPLLGARWYIHQRNASDEVTRHVADDLNLTIQGKEGVYPDRLGRRFDWGETLYHALLSLVYGFMVFEKVFTVDEGGKLHIRKLAPRMPHTIAADGIKTERDGGLVSITQRGDNGHKPVTIPVDRLVVVTHEKVDNDWRGQSVLRAIYPNWMSKNHALDVNDIAIERNGAGVVVATAPNTEGLAPDKADETMEYLLDAASCVRAGDYAGVAIPYGSKLDIKGVYGTQSNILGTLNYHNQEISNALLQYFANLANSSHGSHAQSKDVTKTYASSLNATADRIANVFNAHVVEDLVTRNYGEAEPAPAIEHEEIGVDMTELVALMTNLKDSGLIFADRETEEWIRREAGLPAKQEPPREADEETTS